jgi:hypothetical protein
MMIKCLLTVLISLLLGAKGYSQTINIDVSQAKNFIGKLVSLHGDVLVGKIFKDSVAVFDVGSKSTPDHVTIVITAFKFKIDQKLINTLRFAKASFTGLLLSQGLGNPLIIVDDPKNISFNTHPE